MEESSKKIDLLRDDDFVRIESQPVLTDVEVQPRINVFPNLLIEPQPSQNHLSDGHELLLDQGQQIENGEHSLNQKQKVGWFALEPETFWQKIESFFVNTYVEWVAALIGGLALFYPTYSSLVIAIMTQIFFIGLPLQIIDKQQLRLKVYDIVVKIGIGILILILCVKAFLLYDGSTTDESYGFYFVKQQVHAEDGTVTEDMQLDMQKTFFFELFTLGGYLLIWVVTNQIKKEVETSVQLKLIPATFLGNRQFSQKKTIFKYIFLCLTLYEVLSMPDVLALPVLFSFLLLMICAITDMMTNRNRASFTDTKQVSDAFISAFTGDEGFVGWALNKERLFSLTLTWQKTVMMIQLFEFIVTHIAGVKKTIVEEQQEDVTQLSLTLYTLRCIGHAEFQTRDQDSDFMSEMFVTVLIIFFGQICSKASYQFYKFEEQDEVNGENMSHLETKELDAKALEILNKGADLVLNTGLNLFTVITFGRKRQTVEGFRKSLYGYLPVGLNWIVRFAVAFFAYMYNSQVGFYHLVWVLTSFIVPLKFFYAISVLILFPIVCVEFALVYVASIKNFDQAYIFKNPLFNLYQFHPVNQQLELCLMYSIVVLFGLLIPARIRFKAYHEKHGGSDMLKDMLIIKIYDPHSSVLWKIVFIMAVHFHTIVLFLMLFIGNQNFNLFQLGFMFFFIAYGASHWLYVKTSILLPLFISYFIANQYYWSLIYDQNQSYNTRTDFYFMVDGWEPPADPEDYYFIRKPSVTLWSLLLVMHLMHSICQQFPNTDQNLKHLQECDKHISNKNPLIAKWMKLIWDALFMIILVSVLLVCAKNLISQQSNVINLVYLILFVITFGKMCQTSLDGSSHKKCIFYANLIKTYSAVVLIVLVVYHCLRFEFFDLEDWFIRERERKSFYVLYLTLFGFSEDEAGTKSIVQQYTAYLIVGQILEYHFDKGRQKHEGRDLYDWNTAFKTFKGVKRAHSFFQFDIAYMVYRWFSYWKWIDFAANYFHIITNGIIVYFSLQISISLFFALHISIIVFFYCYSSYKSHHATKEKGINKYDLQQATDVCRNYKKISHDITLKLRQQLWMTQYVITLAFMFTGYLDEFIDAFREQSDQAGTLRQHFETIQFYFFWTGVYFPDDKTRKITGLQPLHIIFFIILFEKQAQNWLFSRWGLNNTMISKFAKLEFLLKLQKNGREWINFDKNHPARVKYCQEIMEPEQINLIVEEHKGTSWMMEDFNNTLIAIWSNIKVQSKDKTKEDFDRSHINPQNTSDEFVDTMIQSELVLLEKDLKEHFNLEFEVSKDFKKYKQQIGGRDCVLYQQIKDLILEKLYKKKFINQTTIPFLSYSHVRQLRYDIQTNLQIKFIDAAQKYNEQHGIDISEKSQSEKSNIRLFQLRRDLMKLVSRRYSYEMWGGMRIVFEQTSLMLLMLNVIIKCNIASLVYLALVTNYLLRQSKQTAMRNMVYVIGVLFFCQYWMYLFNLTSESSPQPFPQSPYPNLECPEGKYFIPVMYKLDFGQNMFNAYWYSFGVEIFTVKALWIDFLTLVLVAVYLYYYRNPVLSTNCQSFSWCHQTNKSKLIKKEDDQDQRNSEVNAAANESVNLNKPPVDFFRKLNEYHQLMNQKYPTEQENITSNQRLRELKDNCFEYVTVRNSKILIFTTMHIFTMIVILLMALCRRSFVSLGYIIFVGPCLRSSATVLKQHERYQQCQKEIESRKLNPEFQHLPELQQKKIIEDIQKKYKWSFIKLICVYLSIYSYLDFVSQVVYQIPYIPDEPVVEHFGLRKIYPPQSETFDYMSFISGKYEPPRLNFSNLLMQILMCIIMVTISTQSELFKSEGYKNFLEKPKEGLDLLMKLAILKKEAITYSFNNAKLMKIIALQKTEQQIFGCVERIKVNVDMFRKSQQRMMLEEYCRTYGGMYIPPDPQPSPEQLATQEEDSEKFNEEHENPHKRLAQAIINEKQRREKLVAEQTMFVTKNILPYRAQIYLFMMRYSQSYIFIHRATEMMQILSDMKEGKQNTGIDLIKVIRSDLFVLLKRLEKENRIQMTVWPQLSMQDLRQTQIYCKWSHIIARLIASIFRAIISNTATIAYICMLLSIYTNAGAVAIIYPFAVFGFALLEETRPGKQFWRVILSYSLTLLLLKYIVNLNIVHTSLETTSVPFIDGFIKFGLHHLEETKDLVWHMLPEMMIVTSILCHEIVEQFTGLYDKSEYEVENVQQAIERIFKKHGSKSDKNIADQHHFKVVDRMSTGESGLDFKSQRPKYSVKSRNNILEQWDIAFTRNRTHSLTHQDQQREDFGGGMDESQLRKSKAWDRFEQKLQEIKLKDEEMEFDKLSRQTTSSKALHSVVKDREDDDGFLKVENIDAKVKPDELKIEFKGSFSQRQLNDDTLEQPSIVLADQEIKLPKQSFWNSEYMNRLFPLVQQQKPGTDYYGYQTFALCILCFYLLSNFNEFSATGPYQEQNIFQTEMTVVLFYQITMIILDRYISRTENRHSIERKENVSKAIKPTIDQDSLFLPVQHDDLTVRLVVQKLKFQFLAEKSNIDALSKLKHQQDMEIKIIDALKITPQQKCKFILHWVNLILVHGYIFWYLPIQANTILYGNPNCGFGQIYGCKDFEMNNSLQNFYVLYLFYFYFSARQISQGLPSFRRGSSTMLYEGSDSFLEEEDIGNTLHQIFINIPLAAEIRCLLDFTFTKTSIDLWQTCQLFQYNSDFFIAKTSNRSYNRKVLGSEPTTFSKVAFGYICTTIMLSFILGPFIMFSSVGGMTMYNPVLDNDLQFWVQLNFTTTRVEGMGDDQVVVEDHQVLPFKLYDNESPSIYDFDEKMFSKRQFDQWPETKFFDPVQLQLIVATYYSDTTWIASDATRAVLQKYACIANIQSAQEQEVPAGCTVHGNVSNVKDVSIGFQLKTLFEREGPDLAKAASGIQQRNLDPSSPEDRNLMSQFAAIMTEECTSTDSVPSYTLNITNFFLPKILLGETSSAQPIYFSTRETQEQALRNILLTYKCKDQWAVSTGTPEKEVALEFTVFNQRIQVSFLQGYNVMTFYTGIVLFIGMYMRPIFIFNSNRAFIYETNYPDPMLRLCESIHLSRARGNLIQEDENYRMLQEIVRSPELLHALTGSNMKGGVAPSEEEKKSHLVPKALY